MFKDQRIEKLAKLLVEYSTNLVEGDRVLVYSNYAAKPLVKEIVKEAYKAKAMPEVVFFDDEISRLKLERTTPEQIEIEAEETYQKWKKFDASIYIRASENEYENKNIPTETMQKMAKENRKRVNHMVDNMKWSLLNYPTASMAQRAQMSVDDFADYVFNVATIDYIKMSEAMNPLVERMQQTDKVRLVSPGTDLTFSIKDIGVVKCDGKMNIPDGEVYTAPVRDSVNGVIKYNTPCPYMGEVYHDVELTFENGKIVKAQARENSDKLFEIFQTDKGASYVGEFAIGLHPLISDPMGDILFDEKIHGSIHFTPGMAYPDANNNNQSAIHWDMVLIQRAEYGGGEMYFDDVLVRKDGIFVEEELKGLNPENLK
jgi:aminopeptidase